MRRALAVGVLALGAAACSSGSGAAGAHPRATATTLRAAGERRGVTMGAAVAAGPLRTDARYRAVLARQYGMVTPENAMKWATVEPEPGQHAWDDADALVDFAAAHGQQVRGHALVWYRALPAWLTARPLTAGEAEQTLRQHILTEVGRYRSRVAQWDVVNEALANDGTLRPNPFLAALGPRYIDLAFRWAHEADPSARLYYNDYGIDRPGPKARAALALVRRLRAAGVPIDGVGVQAHQPPGRPADATALRAALRRFAAAGVDVAVTELDVPLRLPADGAARDRQAADYAAVLRACLAVERCRTFVTWGFTDAHSWIPARYPGYGDALPFDAALAPKPAVGAMTAALAAPG